MFLGEQHFASAGSPLMYWSSLWLTGQLETAIEFLTRQDDKLQTHAVHIAIATHQASMLITPIDCRAKLCLCFFTFSYITISLFQ